jgi:uncharacterized lipoprotein YajG
MNLLRSILGIGAAALMLAACEVSEPGRAVTPQPSPAAVSTSEPAPTVAPASGQPDVAPPPAPGGYPYPQP